MTKVVEATFNFFANFDFVRPAREVCVMNAVFRVEGKMSTFGGPDDNGMRPDEGLALFSSEQDMRNHGLGDFLLSSQQAGFTGLGRRLNPDKPYLACRWWETDLKKEFLRNTSAWVENAKTGVRLSARPVDAGPHDRTHRVADLSPGLAKALGLITNDICRVSISNGASEFAVNLDHTSLTASVVPAGPRIFLTEEWMARPPKVSYFPRSTAVGIVVHHTEGANRDALQDATSEKAAAFANARQIQLGHFARGWSDTGQNFTISQGGIIMEGRHGTVDAAKMGQVLRGAHAPAANDEWWGIEVAGDNRKKYLVTKQQWDALVELCAWLWAVAGSPLKIEPHNHFQSTTCPGKIVDNLEELRKAVRQQVQKK